MEENNKIIAEFMGWSTHPRHGDKYLINKSKDRVNLPWYSECNWEASLREFNYHSDWNILMPVVEKIKQFLHNSIKESLEGKKVLNSLKKLDIQYTYKTCVEFINFYNKQKEE